MLVELLTRTLLIKSAAYAGAAYRSKNRFTQFWSIDATILSSASGMKDR